MTQDNGGQQTIGQMFGEVSDYETILLDRWAGDIVAALAGAESAEWGPGFTDEGYALRAHMAYEQSAALLLEKRRQEGE